MYENLLRGITTKTLKEILKMSPVILTIMAFGVILALGYAAINFMPSSGWTKARSVCKRSPPPSVSVRRRS